MAAGKRSRLSWGLIRRKLSRATYRKGKRNEEIVVVLHTNQVQGNWSQEEFSPDDEEDINSGHLGFSSSHIAAIKIQASFRRHLARRAYRALRSLVKLQALARGVVVRRQARIALQCMQALARLQITVRARQLHLLRHQPF